MKTTTQIIKEIEKARAKIIDTAKTEKELDREILRQAIKEGGAHTEQARANYEAAQQRYILECVNNENQKLIIEILKDNFKQAFLNEYGAIICEIWNKYAGKPHGEKTADKIRDELKTATGYYIYINNQYGDARICAQTVYKSAKKMPVNDVEMSPKWNGEKRPAIDNNNKIVALDPDSLRVNYCGAYVEKPAEHVKQIRKAHKAAQEAQKALENATSAYNELTRGNMQHASAREGVKNWLI